jgi:hypothetical protein
MNSSGTKESINPDFQFQQYDDLNNKFGITTVQYFLRILIARICGPAQQIALLVAFVGLLLINDPYCVPFTGNKRCDAILYAVLSVPLLFIVPAYLYENSSLEMISILFAVYYYGCVLYLILTRV